MSLSRREDHPPTHNSILVLPSPQMSLFQVLLERHWMTPHFIGTVEALLILRRWMKMTTTIFDNSQGCDLCQGKNSKDGRDHHHSSDHLRDYCRDHHRFKGFLGPPAGAGLPASSSSSGRWESLLSSAVHRTDSLLPHRHLTNRCNKMHLCAMQMNKFSSSSLCFPKKQGQWRKESLLILRIWGVTFTLSAMPGAKNTRFRANRDHSRSTLGDGG